MKSFSEKEKLGTLYPYGCIMIVLNIPDWQVVIETIKEEDLYDINNPTRGYETNPHISVVYGLEPTISDKDIKNFFSKCKINDFNIKIEKIGIFENSNVDFDVVKMDVKCDYLTSLNKEIIEHFPVNITYKTYFPHITMAFVNRGKGHCYMGMKTCNIEEIKIDKIIYTKVDGSKIIIL